MTLDVTGRHYGAAEDARRMRRLELFGQINRRRDALRRQEARSGGHRATDPQLVELEREYADLMRISRAAGYR